jgi:hypothetical protein
MDAVFSSSGSLSARVLIARTGSTPHLAPKTVSAWTRSRTIERALFLDPVQLGAHSELNAGRTESEYGIPSKDLKSLFLFTKLLALIA